MYSWSNSAFPILFVFILSFLSSKSTAQDVDVNLQLVQEQVDAFNQGDIERMLNNLSEDFRWYYIGADTLMLEVDGKDHFKQSMLEYYKQVKKVDSRMDQYYVEANRVSFREVVSYETHGGSKGETSAMAIYEIREGKIFRVWYYL